MDKYPHGEKRRSRVSKHEGQFNSLNQIFWYASWEHSLRALLSRMQQVPSLEIDSPLFEGATRGMTNPKIEQCVIKQALTQNLRQFFPYLFKELGIVSAFDGVTRKPMDRKRVWFFITHVGVHRFGKTVKRQPF
jgi:hypothetical protein